MIAASNLIVITLIVNRSNSVPLSTLPFSATFTPVEREIRGGEAVGRGGGQVTRIGTGKGGETHVYFSGGEGHGKNLGAEASEVSEDEVKKTG